MCGIYLIRNTITNKVYIGQSNDIKRRWSEHKARAFNLENNCSHKPLYLSMRKYGLDAFQLEILCECSIDELDEQEQKYIEEYNSLTPNGYNILSGGQQFRAEIKQYYCKNCGEKITKYATQELCINCWHKLNRKTERPTKEQLIEQLQSVNGNFEALGRYYNLSGNAIRKWCKQYNISSYSSDYKTKKEKQLYKIAVNQIDKNTGEIIATYESSMAAARALGKKKGSHITEVCKGIHETAYGYKWEYAALM